MKSPIIDLAGLTLEVNDLERALAFYQGLFGLSVGEQNPEHGWARLQVGEFQSLTLWQPVTRRPFKPELTALHPRGAAHLHYAWQVLLGDLDLSREVLSAHGCAVEDINLGTPERPDLGLYFFDPFGHGLEIRAVDPDDVRRPRLPVQRSPQPSRPGGTLPVVGLREVALAFGDYPAMLERLPRAYGFALAKEQDGRDFAQFTLGPSPKKTATARPGAGSTPGTRRWAWPR